MVDELKTRDYLLSSSHPVGRFKAGFFRSLGYTPDAWSLLRDDLLELARSGDADECRPSPFGTKYEVRGSLEGPNGGAAKVVTVWIVLARPSVPRLVTAYPE